MSVTFSDLSAVKAAQDEILSPSCRGGWMVVGYTGPATLALEATGSGGVEEVVGKLQDDKVQYVLIRVQTHTHDTSKTRDVFITWTGPRVGIIERGKKKAHAGEVEKVFGAAHATLTATGKRNFTLSEVLAKSEPLSGSHEIAD